MLIGQFIKHLLMISEHVGLSFPVHVIAIVVKLFQDFTLVFETSNFVITIEKHKV
jgi:hypothetical protein